MQGPKLNVKASDSQCKTKPCVLVFVLKIYDLLVLRVPFLTSLLDEKKTAKNIGPPCSRYQCMFFTLKI